MSPQAKILIVDDKPSNLHALRQLLSGVDAEIIEASSGNAALWLMLEHPLALVLLDVNMPGMDGYEVAEMARKMDHSRHTPILFVTAAFKDDIHRIRGYECGAIDYIEKPIDDVILLAKVRLFLELYTARRQAERTALALRQEIEQRKEMEKELLLTRFVVDHMGDAAFLIDEDARFRYVNQAACQCLGYSQEELLAMGVPDIDPDFPRSRWEESWRQQRVAGNSTLQSRHRRKDGSIFPVEILANYIQLEGREHVFAFARDISARKKAEEKLIASEHRTRAILNTTTEGYWCIDPLTRKTIEVNPAMCRMLGEDDMIGRTPMEFADEENRKIFQAQMQKIQSTDHRSYEITLRAKDGKAVHALFNATTLRNASGEGVAAFAFVTDISRRVESEERLRLLSRAVEESPLSILITDHQGIIQYVNPKFQQVTGYQAEEAIGQKPSVLKSGLTPVEVYADLWSTITQGREWHGELCNRRKDGSLYWEFASISPVLWQGGIQHFVAVKEDITARRRVEEDLRQSKLQYDRLTDRIPVGVYKFRIAADGRMSFDFVSGRFCSLLGISRETLLLDAGAAFDLVHDDEREAFRRLNEEAGRNLTPFFWVGRFLIDGKVRWMQIESSPKAEDNGDSTWDGVIIDITEQKLLEKSLQEARQGAEMANRSKSEFLATMSHEIRTPMNAILGMSDLLAESHLDHEQQQYIAVVRNSGENLLQIINDILDISKVDAGKLELHAAAFDLRQVVHSANEVIRYRSQEKNLYHVVFVTGDVPNRLSGDASRLRQILINFLGNAVKFTESGTIATLVTSHPQNEHGHNVTIRVVDTGVGVPEAQQGRIFEAFHQADASSTRKYGGTGLGLAICRRLAQMMGGTIGLHSREGRGSTFYVTLPFTILPAEKADDHGHLEGMRIVLQHDHPGVALHVEEVLKAHGAVVRFCRLQDSLPVILSALQGGEGVDLLLIHHQGDTADCIASIKAVRGLDHLGHLPVAVFGLCHDQGSLKGLREAGGDCISDPFDQTLFVNSLRHLILNGKAKAPPTRTAPARKRILIVDDSEENIVLLQVFLRKTSHTLEIARHGREALLKVIDRGEKFDLILMDIQMPFMDGYEATRRIRQWEQEHGIPSTPILALSAHAMAGDEQKSLSAGCDAHVTKPIRKDRLLEIVHRFIAGDQTSFSPLPRK